MSGQWKSAKVAPNKKPSTAKKASTTGVNTKEGSGETRVVNHKNRPRHQAPGSEGNTTRSNLRQNRHWKGKVQSFLLNWNQSQVCDREELKNMVKTLVESDDDLRLGPIEEKSEAWGKEEMVSRSLFEILMQFLLEERRKSCVKGERGLLKGANGGATEGEGALPLPTDQYRSPFDGLIRGAFAIKFRSSEPDSVQINSSQHLASKKGTRMSPSGGDHQFAAMKRREQLDMTHLALSFLLVSRFFSIKRVEHWGLRFGIRSTLDAACSDPKIVAEVLQKRDITYPPWEQWRSEVTNSSSEEGRRRFSSSSPGFQLNFLALCKEFPSLTLTHCISRFKLFPRDSSTFCTESITVAQLFDTFFFGPYLLEVSERRGKYFAAPCRQGIVDALRDTLLQGSSQMMRCFSGAKEGQSFLLKFLTRVLRTVCHHRFPGFYYPEKTGYMQNQERVDKRRDKISRETHQDVLFAAKILGCFPLTQGGGSFGWVSSSGTQPQQEGRGSSGEVSLWEEVPTWIPWTRKTHPGGSIEFDHCIYPPSSSVGMNKTFKDQVAAFEGMDSLALFGESQKIFLREIDRYLKHIVTVKQQSKSGFCATNMKSRNWGMAMIYRSWRHEVSMDRAMLHKYFKVSRERLLRAGLPIVDAAGSSTNHERNNRNSSFISYFGRMTYDPLTRVFEFLFGEEMQRSVGYPKNFFSKIWSKKTVVGSGDGGKSTESETTNNQRRHHNSNNKNKKHSIYTSPVICGTCHYRGHLGRECPRVGRVVCHWCRYRGHNSQRCKYGSPMRRSGMNLRRDIKRLGVSGKENIDYYVRKYGNKAVRELRNGKVEADFEDMKLRKIYSNVPSWTKKATEIAKSATKSEGQKQQLKPKLEDGDAFPDLLS